MSAYLGLDCGGTSCRALVMDEAGRPLFEGGSGPANWASTPHRELLAHLRAATTGIPAVQAVAACFAGLMTPQNKASAERALKRLYPGAKVVARPDYWAVLAACPAGTDACVIAGTGSTVFSWKGDGVARSGGGGYILGDFGSAYRYGLEVVRRYYHRGASSISEASVAAIAKCFGSSEPSEVISALYAQPSPAACLATLADRVAFDADLGHAYARDALERETGRLVETVFAHLDAHVEKKTEYAVTAAGGLWRAHPIFLSRFRQRLFDRMSPSVALVTVLERPAVEGAVALARRLVAP
ncbi:MAG: hypothetical protein KIS66_08895 [Fimbriimonadaceae bacterium]|nr:hypothetical protein [Fimbriimonadaceae bacterium]